MAEYIVSSGEVSSGIILNRYDSMKVWKSGTASSTTINSSGSMFVFVGGSANSTEVNPGGHLGVFSGGMATNIVEKGGYLDIDAGADVTFAPNTFSGLVLSNTRATVHSGTIANNTTVNSGGDMTIFSGGIANDITVKGGYSWTESGVVKVSSGGTANNVTVKFGDDGSVQFASLSGMGAFFDVTTEHIFEESGKGILASL